MDKLKIAYVKSIKYQDLWINDITKHPFTLLKTSTVRVPPIGLAENYNSTFIIINNPSEELQQYESIDFNPYSNE